MLTKEQINSIRHVVTCDDLHLTECASEELRRLALLGLERDATIAAAQSAGHKAGRAAATAEYKAEIERLHGVIKGWELKWSQRDERAERVGRAAILAVDNGWSAHEVYTEIVEAMEASDE